MSKSNVERFGLAAIGPESRHPDRKITQHAVDRWLERTESGEKRSNVEKRLLLFARTGPSIKPTMRTGIRKMIMWGRDVSYVAAEHHARHGVVLLILVVVAETVITVLLANTRESWTIE